MTNRAVLAAKLSREIVSPETTSGKAKLGAFVPRSNIVDSVRAIRFLLFSIGRTEIFIAFHASSRKFNALISISEQ
jgi:hypothetical protein